MAFGTKAVFDAVREVAFGSIGASYAALGGVTTDQARIITFQNSTNEDVYISLNGSSNQIRLAANNCRAFDFTANEVTPDGLFIPKGTQFYIKYVSAGPTSGAVWIEVVYGTGGV